MWPAWPAGRSASSSLGWWWCPYLPPWKASRCETSRPRRRRSTSSCCRRWRRCRASPSSGLACASTSRCRLTCSRSTGASGRAKAPFRPLTVFELTRSKPFSPENGWLVWGLLNYGAAFVAIAIAAGAASLFENGVSPSGNGTVDVIAPLVRATVAFARLRARLTRLSRSQLSSDAFSFVSLLTVTSVVRCSSLVATSAALTPRAAGARARGDGIPRVPAAVVDEVVRAAARRAPRTLGG